MMVLNSVFSFPPCIPLHISPRCHGNAREFPLKKPLRHCQASWPIACLFRPAIGFCAPRSCSNHHRALSPQGSVAVLDVLAQPPDTLAVALSHDNRDHENLDGPDTLQWDLALAGGLVHAQLVAELVLGHSIRVVDLVAENDKRHLGELLHLEQGVQLCLGLGEALVILGVDQEDDAVDLGEVVPPQPTG